MNGNTIINKMSLYDIVTLIVPSSLVCWAYCYPSIEDFTGWVSNIALLGIIITIGLVLKHFGAWWASCWFRNNTEMIQEEEEKQQEEHKFSACAFLHTWVCDPIRFIFGPAIKLCHPQEKDQAKLKKYYSAYDKAYNDAYYCKRIEILESHVAFLQTWIWAIVVCMFAYLMPENALLNVNIWVLVGAVYLSIVIMCTIQRKIYNLIWEHDNYEEKQV